jgi:tRNA threonylcarbamoyladenosine biosynthesis protein TsaE
MGADATGNATLPGFPAIRIGLCGQAGSAREDGGVAIGITLPDAGATDRLGARLARLLGPGDAVLLSGGLGAGKTALARAVIRVRLADRGLPEEDIPSPTFTLVQSYGPDDAPILHADLYRLGGPAELVELGLAEAFGRALVLVEWPDRLGPLAPPRHLALALAEEGEGRRATITARGGGWDSLISGLTEANP